MFLDKKWELPLEAYKYTPPLRGFALCCGEVPRVDFDWPVKTQIGHMACLKCKRQLGVLGGTVQFLYEHWNRAHPGQPLHGVPEGFFWCAVRACYSYMGGKSEAGLGFALLKQSGDTWQNYCLHRDAIFQLDMADSNGPRRKDKLKHGPWIMRSEACCTDGSRWPVMHIYVTGVRRSTSVEQWLHISFNERDY